MQVQGARPRARSGKWGSIALATVFVGVAVATVWSIFMAAPSSNLTLAQADITGSTSQVAGLVGSSGLPLPRFVSLKADKVNVRKGPSSEHKVAWVFNRKGMPVEIIAEYENWRRIRDSDGQEGWILQNMLSGKRMVNVAPWRPAAKIALYSEARIASPPVAMVEAGVLGAVDSCSGDWCQLSMQGVEGYMEQSQLWGVYPGESVRE